MDNRLSGLRPAVLDAHLPAPASYFVLDWEFGLNLAHRSFVRVEAFHFSPGHDLRTPLFLGVTVHPDVQFKPVPSHETALLEDHESRLLCHADITRTDDRWQARFRSGVTVVGRAHGTLGPGASSQLVEAALLALVRHVAASGGRAAGQADQG